MTWVHLQITDHAGWIRADFAGCPERWRGELDGMVYYESVVNSEHIIYSGPGVREWGKWRLSRLLASSTTDTPTLNQARETKLTYAEIDDASRDEER